MPMVRTICLGSAAACVMIAGGHAADRIETTAEGALTVAAKLIEEGGYGEAEAILRTLAAGDPAHLDMRKVDILAARIAHERGNTDEAVRILTALSDYDPSDWRPRYQMADALMDVRRDREAEKILRTIIDLAPPPIIVAKAKADLRTIDERRVVRLSFRASAAPSTNINSATSDETFDLFGFLPSVLDDEARKQSGFGASYALSGALTPSLGRGVRGHFSAQGQAVDYDQTEFDQATARVETGLRLGAGRMSGLAAATYEHRYFGGKPYAVSAGGRLSMFRPLNNRLGLGVEVSAEQVTYEEQSERDGPVFGMGAQLLTNVTRGLRLVTGVAANREAAQAETLANTQYTGTLGFDAALPARINLAVRPQVTFRRFDKTAQVYGERRKDQTIDVAATASVRDFDVGGFSPSLTYRYTDNRSTVDLFDYDRHSVDMGLTRAF